MRTFYEGSLYDEGGNILSAPRRYCPVCGEHQLIEWRTEVGGECESHALCLNTNCEYEY